MGDREVRTEGGAYVEGDVHAGEYVGRDKVIHKLVQVFTGDANAARARGAQRNRQAMIQRVRNDWIEGVLHQSLYQVARIELQMEEQPGAVAHPWEMIVQEQGRAPRPLPADVRMGEVFDELGGALLLLGAPGTGKTTMLLELAEQLLERAEKDTDHPIPVVFNLSTWAVDRKPLAEWLVDELNRRYDVPRKTAQAWVDGDEILPLLDGLDEVAQAQREGGARAINAYREAHGLLPLAACSREEAYEALEARLRLGGAVRILSLTPAQVDGYLDRAGERLAGVREALRADGTLYELFETR